MVYVSWTKKGVELSKVRLLLGETNPIFPPDGFKLYFGQLIWTDKWMITKPIYKSIIWDIGKTYMAFPEHWCQHSLNPCIFPAPKNGRGNMTLQP